MNAALKSAKRPLATLAAACLSVALGFGCGDDGLGKRYSVSGTVKYKGQPVPFGRINFVPDKPDAAATGGASGDIKDGTYTLTTLTPNDGAFPGTYFVCVEARDPVDGEKIREEVKKKGANTGILPPEMVGKASKNSKNHVPDKYGVPTSSPLKAEVKSSATLNFDLTD